MKTIKIVLDGDKWCAYREEGFTDIQECNAGFGATEIEALKKLIKIETEG